MLMHDQWHRALARLRSEVDPVTFDSFLGRLALDRIDGVTFVATLPTAWLCGWVREHHADQLLQHLRVETPEAELRIACRGIVMPVRPMLKREIQHRAVQIASQIAEAASTAEVPSFHSLVAGHLTFETFCIGTANQLAHAAAQRVAKAPGHLYNPLVVHAGAGRGKTHLLQAIAAESEARGRTVALLAGELCNRQLAQCGPATTTMLRNVDVLIIDDIQFVVGKSAQRELMHIIAAVIEAGGRVVASADQPLDELAMLDDRLQGLLAGGLAVDIGEFDADLCRSILAARIAETARHHAGFAVPDDVRDFILDNCAKTGRHLEGAVKRLAAHSQLARQDVTVELAMQVLHDLMPSDEPRRVRIDDILRVTARHFNVSRADIVSQRRTANIVMPRQIVMYLAKSLTPLSLPEIGRRMGGRDHTTVLHAVRKIGDQRRADAGLNAVLDALSRRLLDGSAA